MSEELTKKFIEEGTLTKDEHGFLHLSKKFKEEFEDLVNRVVFNKDEK